MEQEEEYGSADEPGEEGPDAVRKGSKADYRGRNKPSRQRSAPGSKNTKAPMDSDCGCGGKKGRKGGCSCSGKKDGGMGGPGELYAPATASVRQKNARDSSCGMRRGDSLTVHEYLAACDLGIQNQPTGYIRARLDATERLDLKCGRGSISQGEKCRKGTAQQVSPQVAAAKNMAARVNKSGSALEFSTYNKRTGALTSKSSSEKNPYSIRRSTGRGALIGAGALGGIGALQGAALGAAVGGPGGALGGAVGGALSGALTGGVLGGAAGAGIGAAQKVSWRPRSKRRDSVWAQGFQP